MLGLSVLPIARVFKRINQLKAQLAHRTDHLRGYNCHFMVRRNSGFLEPPFVRVLVEFPSNIYAIKTRLASGGPLKLSSQASESLDSVRSVQSGRDAINRVFHHIKVPKHYIHASRPLVLQFFPEHRILGRRIRVNKALVYRECYTARSCRILPQLRVEDPHVSSKKHIQRFDSATVQHPLLATLSACHRPISPHVQRGHADSRFGTVLPRSLYPQLIYRPPLTAITSTSPIRHPSSRHAIVLHSTFIKASSGMYVTGLSGAAEAHIANTGCKNRIQGVVVMISFSGWVMSCNYALS
ncbi:hypothetical protein VTO73DRAFT_13107 [Trametes versicolor]